MAAGDKKAALSGLTGSAELRSRLLFVLFAMLTSVLDRISRYRVLIRV